MTASTSTSAAPVKARDTVVDSVLLLPVAAVAGLAVTGWALSAGQSQVIAAVNLAVFWAFVAAAVLALPKPSLRRSAVLLLFVAAAWFLPDLQLSTVPVLWTIGFLLAFLGDALVVQLVLSFPEGRIWSLPARLTVAATYVATVGLASLAALFEPDGRNVLLAHADETFSDAIGQAAAALGLVSAASFAVLIGRRLLSLRGPTRRAVLPMLLGALLFVPVTAAWLAAAAIGNQSDADDLATLDRFVTIFIPLGFGAGLIWTRLRRSGAASLVVELREGGVETLRERLARALGDPTLEVVYWLDETTGYVDAAGDHVELPARSDRAVTQIVAGGAPVAALIHDPALLDEPDLVESVRATAALVLENARLAAEIRAQLAEVHASRARIVAATDEERRRLERDLHDGAQQRLVGLSLQLGLARIDADPASARALGEAQDDLERALAELREFARGVHPSLLREDGLDVAVRSLARRAPVPVRVSGSASGRLPDAVELAAYFFVSEALTNVAKHADASHVEIELARGRRLLEISVSDDGVGGAELARGSGLAGLADRLAALNGDLNLASRPGAGTTLTAHIPCAS